MILEEGWFSQKNNCAVNSLERQKSLKAKELCLLLYNRIFVPSLYSTRIKGEK